MLQNTETKPQESIFKLVAIGQYAKETLQRLNSERLGAAERIEINNESDIEGLEQRIKDAYCIFLVVDCFSEQGTDLAVSVANLAQKNGLLTLTIALLPEHIENPKLFSNEQSLANDLFENSDSYCAITLPQTSVEQAKAAYTQQADIVLTSISGMIESTVSLIVKQGMIGVDFSDLAVVTRAQGEMAFEFFQVKRDGENVLDALNTAFSNSSFTAEKLPLGANLIMHLRAGPSLSMAEFNSISESVRSYLKDNCVCVVGLIIEAELTDSLQLCLVATGLNNKTPPMSLFKYRDLWA